jgi:hypothetical protein
MAPCAPSLFAELTSRAEWEFLYRGESFVEEVVLRHLFELREGCMSHAVLVGFGEVSQVGDVVGCGRLFKIKV